ncbi:hypothetical protein [Rhodococcus sp. UFZ-B548]|uniref:hypothetical protein n=1 Tax=Rhodococcus sp. UFZ-B548 TaxID=2742212 RepID=UPI002174DF80|nr:hypothetical protein [Rhodococcus sp. UFZ-B548]
MIPDHGAGKLKVIDSLMAIKDHTDTRARPADPVLLAGHRRLIVDAAHIRATQSLPGKAGQKHRALARRIGVRIEDYLRFAGDPHGWDWDLASGRCLTSKNHPVHAQPLSEVPQPE